jgi:hypothetical protein
MTSGDSNVFFINENLELHILGNHSLENLLDFTSVLYLSPALCFFHGHLLQRFTLCSGVVYHPEGKSEN